jgi:hypothetical protein
MSTSFSRMNPQLRRASRFSVLALDFFPRGLDLVAAETPTAMFL